MNPALSTAPSIVIAWLVLTTHFWCYQAIAGCIVKLKISEMGHQTKSDDDDGGLIIFAGEELTILEIGISAYGLRTSPALPVLGSIYNYSCQIKRH